MHTCIRTQYAYVHSMHTCTHAHIHKYIHACTHTYMRAHIHTCVHTYVHTCLRKYAYTYIRACVVGYTRTYLRKKINIIYIQNACTCINRLAQTCIHTCTRSTQVYMHAFIQSTLYTQAYIRTCTVAHLQAYTCVHVCTRGHTHTKAYDFINSLHSKVQ